MPVNAISRQCDADFGSGIFFALMITKTIAAESRNRVAANPTGGRSPSPIFIKIQVVPQIRQRISQTMVRVPRTLRSLEKAQARLALFQNAPPSQVNSRNYTDNYYMVLSPDATGDVPVEKVRHTYLHLPRHRVQSLLVKVRDKRGK